MPLFFHKIIYYVQKLNSHFYMLYSNIKKTNPIGNFTENVFKSHVNYLLKHYQLVWIFMFQYLNSNRLIYRYSVTIYHMCYLPTTAINIIINVIFCGFD